MGLVESGDGRFGDLRHRLADDRQRGCERFRQTRRVPEADEGDVLRHAQPQFASVCVATAATFSSLQTRAVGRLARSTPGR